MTTYTAISATETQSGKPLTESLLTRLANNVLAIQEGDPTAPIIYPSIMPQDSGSVYGLTQRSNGGILATVDSTWRTMFSISLQNNFSAAVTVDIDLDLYITAQNATGTRVELNGTTINTFGSLNTNTQLTHRVLAVSIPTGANTMTFDVDTPGSIVRIYGMFRARGAWI